MLSLGVLLILSVIGMTIAIAAIAYDIKHGFIIATQQWEENRQVQIILILVWLGVVIVALSLTAAFEWYGFKIF